MAVPSALAMSKVTPPTGAGADRLTVKLAVTVPLLPSTTATLSIVRLTPPHGLRPLAVLRGLGASTLKSVLLVSVSVQPFPLRRAAVVLLSAAVAAPSKQLAVP